MKADSLPNRTTQYISDRIRSLLRAGKAAATPQEGENNEQRVQLHEPQLPFQAG
ncbi:MAG: hypothetical protein IMY85_04800 [Chloroflexi bacterium]|nr:hypothetical protein [Chloroflexota bacterium]